MPQCHVCGVKREDVIICGRCNASTLKRDSYCSRWLHDEVPCKEDPNYDYDKKDKVLQSGDGGAGGTN